MRSIVFEPRLAERLSHELRVARGFHFALALVTETGLDELEDAMRACLRRGGPGRMIVGTDLPSHPHALERLILLEEEHPQTFDVRRFQSPARRYFHPKLYLFLSKRSARHALVGSSNLTDGGLTRNYEANVWTDDQSATAELFDFFDELFEGGYARRITTHWLTEYARLWALRQRQQAADRRLRDQVRTIRRDDPRRIIPKRIKGHRFVFTGKIDGWPREAILYPDVRRLGGTVGLEHGSLPQAHCLVHGEILGGRTSTQKLRKARQMNVPVITEEEFMKIRKAETRVRRKSRA